MITNYKYLLTLCVVNILRLTSIVIKSIYTIKSFIIISVFILFTFSYARVAISYSNAEISYKNSISIKPFRFSNIRSIIRLFGSVFGWYSNMSLIFETEFDIRRIISVQQP